MIPTALRPRIDRETVRVGSLVAVAALVLLGTAVVTAAAASTAPTELTDQDDRPSIDVATTSLTSGETETVAVRLSSAPEGLSGYNLELAVGDTGVARITSAEYPDRFGLTTEPAIDPDGQRITLEAADLDGTVEPGATNVTLARVNVTGVGSGTANLSVEPVQVDGDDGSRIDPVPEPGVVSVGSTDGDGSGGTADDGADESDPAVPAGDATETDAGDATTSGDGPLATLPVLLAVALITLGSVALRRTLS